MNFHFITLLTHLWQVVSIQLISLVSFVWKNVVESSNHMVLDKDIIGNLLNSKFRHGFTRNHIQFDEKKNLIKFRHSTCSVCHTDRCWVDLSYRRDSWEFSCSVDIQLLPDCLFLCSTLNHSLKTLNISRWCCCWRILKSNWVLFVMWIWFYSLSKWD